MYTKCQQPQRLRSGVDEIGSNVSLEGVIDTGKLGAAVPASRGQADVSGTYRSHIVVCFCRERRILHITSTPNILGHEKILRRDLWTGVLTIYFEDVDSTIQHTYVSLIYVPPRSYRLATLTPYHTLHSAVFEMAPSNPIGTMAIVSCDSTRDSI